MAAKPKVRILYSPERLYEGTVQTSWVGAQSVTGQRGTLPTFNDSNSYFINKTTGNDSNAGTAAAPKKTIGSVFTTTQTFNDNGPNAYHLTEQLGSGVHTPYLAYPCTPVPPQGNFAFGGDVSNNSYLNAPAGFRSTMNGRSAWCIEGWVYFQGIAGTSKALWGFTDTTASSLVSNTDGSLTFKLNNVDLTSGAGVVTAGNWYYIACSFSSGTANAKAICVGLTPETCVSVTTATQTYVPTAISAFYLGRNSGGSALQSGYQARVYVTNAVKTSAFPTGPSSSAILARWDFETKCLMESAAKSYIVIQDSSTYNERPYANFRYQLTAGFSIYAAEGQTPEIGTEKGVGTGIYGAGATGITVSATNFYIAKTGNDGTGTRNDATKPFLTIQAALSAGSFVTGDVITITDSATYTENLTAGALNFTLQAAASIIPILKPLTTSASSAHITGTGTITLRGISFEGPLNTNYLVNNSSTASSITVNYCSVRGYTYLTNTAAVLSVTNSFLAKVTSLHSSTGTSDLADCYVKGTTGATFALGFTLNVARCTFADCAVTATCTDSNFTRAYINRCLFQGQAAAAYLLTLADGSSNVNQMCYAVKDCRFVPTGTSIGGMSLAGSNAYVENCYLDGTALTGSTIGMNFASLTRIWMYNVTAFSFNKGIKIVGGITNKAENITTLNCATAGVEATSETVAIGLLDKGSLAAYQGGVVPTYSVVSSVLSSSVGAENTALASGELGVFAGDSKQLGDAGNQASIYTNYLSGVVFNGLTFTGLINEESGISAAYDVAFSLAYCTFSGLGNYGVRAGSSCGISYSLFNTNGNAIKVGGSSCSVTYSVGYECGGAFLQNYGVALTTQYNSSSGCSYGHYDDLGASTTGNTGLVYSNSSTFDYSGEATLTYSCIGTLDPDRSNAVDTNSSRKNPLFVDPLDGDLRLSALENGQLFTSPAKGTAAAGADMGAFVFTYGACVVDYIPITFASVSPSGARYLNPDKVSRSTVAVNLAENEREDGVFESSADTYKEMYTLNWSSVADMPLEQLIELQDLFKCGTNEMRVSMDGGSWFNARLMRGGGFDYAETDEAGYVDGVPMQVNSLTFREA